MTSLQSLEGQARANVLLDLAERKASEDAWLIEYHITEAAVLEAVVASIAAEYAMADSDLQFYGAADIGDASWRDTNWEAIGGRKWPGRVQYILNLPEHMKITRSYVLVREEPVTYRQDGRWDVKGAYDEYSGRRSSYFNNLGDALLAAANAYAESERWAQHHRDEDERREQRKAEREAQATDERQVLLDALEGDKVAIALIKVFAALQDERDEWREEIAGLDSSLNHACEVADRHASRAKELEGQTYRLEDDLRRTNYDVDDLRRKVSDMECKNRRGW